MTVPSKERRGNLMQKSADTSSSSHDPPMGPRAYVEPGSGTQCILRTFQSSKIVKCA